MLYLASRSPQRAMLLKRAQVAFQVVDSAAGEDAITHLPPQVLALERARAKAQGVRLEQKQFADGQAVIVGADTVVALGKAVFGKPSDRADAEKMLTQLQGTSHSVFTGHACVRLGADGAVLAEAARIAMARITLRPMSPDEIRAYVASGESDGRAGGYAIQETGDRFVVDLQGDWDTVVGLNVAMTLRLYRECLDEGIGGKEVVIAILSDIHANLEAAEVVMECCQGLGVSQYLCLGDVIGYGPDPVAVTAIAQQHFPVCLMGNHEEALVTGKHHFNPLAAKAIDWTREQLKAVEGPSAPMAWYKARTPFVLQGNMLMVHGSIYDPVHDYVDEPENPVESQQMIETLSRDFSGFDICFAGHNHTPFLATTLGIMVPHDGHRTFRIPKGHKVYVCVGSVGQPRDRDTRVSFATLDDEMLTFHRLPYDVQKTQQKIQAVGLGRFLAERLGQGM